RGGDVAGRRRGFLGAGWQSGQKTGEQDQAQDGGPHRLPPAMSALPMAPFFASLSAERLYHEITHALPDMITMPPKLIGTCITGPPPTSAKTKWPAKARNTPRQNISRECWPQRIKGRSQIDFNGGQSFGRKRTTIAASARKCAKRSTSRSVLLTGYIQ